MKKILPNQNEASATPDVGPIRYLLAASSGIGTVPIERQFVELSEADQGQEVVVLTNNAGLLRAARDRWPECESIPVPKSRTGIRQLLASVQRLVLYWDGSEELAKLLFEARLALVPTRLVPIEVTRVVNKRLTNDFDVYIGRGSPWGNQFAISRSEDGPDRIEVIEQFKDYFYKKVNSDPAFAKAVLGLRGLRLACFCKPEPCHGDIIANYLDNTDPGDGNSAGGV
jgi:hypothetical protein